jgi:hypothetical protein
MESFDPYDFSEIDDFLNTHSEEDILEMETRWCNTYTIKGILSNKEYEDLENILKEFEKVWEERHPLSIALHIRLFRKQLDNCDVLSYPEEFISSLLKIPLKNTSYVERQRLLNLIYKATFIWNKARTASPSLSRYF